MQLPSIPAPRTWAANTVIGVPQLRADLEQAVALLGQRPYFIGQQTTGESVPSASDTTVTLDTTLTDAWGAFANPAANVYTCQLAGWYLADVRLPIVWSGGSAAAFAAGLSVSSLNSGATAYGARSVSTVSGSVIARTVDLLPMNAGDVAAVLARQESGSTLTLGTASFQLPTVAVRWACARTGTAGLPVPPLTACPSPITSAWLNSCLRDTVNFLTYPPALRAHTTSGSVANSSLSSPQAVTLGTVDLDTYGGYSGSTYTAPVAGRYFVAGQLNFASSSTTATYACGVNAGGTTYWGGAVRFAGSSLTGGASITKRVRLTAGQTIQLVAAQSSGSSLNINTASTTQTRLIVVWEGI